jgi:hypothetical protein
VNCAARTPLEIARAAKAEARAAAASVPTPIDPSRIVALPPGIGGTSYGLAALEREATTLSTAIDGTRNDTPNKSAFAVAQLVAGGELEATHAANVLVQAARVIGLECDEVRKTLASAGAASASQARQTPPRDPIPELPALATLPLHGLAGTSQASSDEDESARAAYDEAMIEQEYRRLGWREAARERLAQRKATEALAGMTVPASSSARELVSRPRERTAPFIEGFLPAKGGKTTTVLNLVRSLVTGGRFWATSRQPCPSRFWSTSSTSK